MKKKDCKSYNFLSLCGDAAINRDGVKFYKGGRYFSKTTGDKVVIEEFSTDNLGELEFVVAHTKLGLLPIDELAIRPYTFVCGACGSDDLEAMSWSDIESSQHTQFIGDGFDDDYSDVFCNRCGTHIQDIKRQYYGKNLI